MKFRSVQTLLIIGAICSVCTACQFAEPESFLIPKGYRGKVYIVFNQTSGQSKQYEGKRRVYDVPNSGILLTQFKDDYGIINQQYFYVDANGNRELLKQIDSRDFNEERTTNKNPHEPSRDELGIFFAGRTGAIMPSGVLSSDDPRTLRVQEFFVCTYRELRESAERWDKEQDQRLRKLTGSD